MLQWSPAEWCTGPGERVADVGDGHQVILRVISHNQIEEGHRDDRQDQYRPCRLLEEQLSQASPGLLRELLGTFINTLLSAEAEVVCGAEYATVSEERTIRRNGYRHHDFDTRAGTVDVAVPKLPHPRGGEPDECDPEELVGLDSRTTQGNDS